MRESEVSVIAEPARNSEGYFNHKPSLSKEQLEAELADARLLHQLSIELIQEDGTAGLYKKIVEAAVAIMRSQFATMQMLFPDAGNIGKLLILASSGFTPEGEEYFKWVYSHTASSCGAVLRSGKRVVVPDYSACAFMQGAATLPVFLEAGILSAQSTPLYSRGGKLLGMISTHWNRPYNPPQRHLDLLDILARQAADLIERTQNAEALRENEERLRALAEEKKLLLTQLEQIVDERTKELQRSNEDLQQFAHVASHDLKEPVRKIKTFGLRLKKELGSTFNEKSRVYTEKILESATRMSTMIEGVLTYSSLNATNEKIETFDLPAILSDIRTDLEVLIQEKDAVIEYEELPAIEGVRVLIYQLFYNLINNSLKFSKENEKPVIKIRAEVAEVDGTAYSNIVVTDNGIGFKPEYSDTIFNTFTRLHSKSRFDGTGLGLSLSKKIVERHNGTIRADGSENGGAVFTITLPVRQPMK